MRGLVWLGDDNLVVDEIAEPRARPGEVVVDVLRAGICGSDLHAYRGNAGTRKPPLVLGHEAVGRVGGSDEVFAIFPLTGCGTCRHCLAGSENLCAKRSLLGLHRPGTFAERVVVAESCLVPLPDGLAVDDAVLAEPLATSLSVFSANSVPAQPPSSQLIVVVGCGPIGLLALHAALWLTTPLAEVQMVDPEAERREVALDLGATSVYATVDELPTAAADLVIDAVGIEETWTGALKTVRPGGTVAVVGLGQSNGNVDMGQIVRSGITLRGSYAYSRRDFEQALALLASSPLRRSLVTTVCLEEGPAAFRLLVKQPGRVLKMLLDPTAEGE